MTNDVRLLIAEDSPEIRMMLKLKLEMDGRFEVVGEAGNGADAVSMTAELLPDIVLLDLGMPVMDGLAALPQIRSAHPGVKVAILSGFPAREVEKQALLLGADLYVEKGSPLNTLAEQLHSVVRTTNST
jgi:DNA-binding NarL/FixJ family response regulator